MASKGSISTLRRIEDTRWTTEKQTMALRAEFDRAPARSAHNLCCSVVLRVASRFLRGKVLLAYRAYKLRDRCDHAAPLVDTTPTDPSGPA
jgi:hypothetical protein